MKILLPLAGFDPNLIENQRQACTASGGQFGKGAAADVYICYQKTRDANQSCQTGLDCDGLCLARSQTCAPVKPLLGCQDVLTNSGMRATLCLD